MTCRELVDFLMDYEEGTLGAEERAVFERHLDACPGCLNYLETYRETVRMGRCLCDDPEAPVPEDVPDELVRAILAARARPTSNS